MDLQETRDKQAANTGKISHPSDAKISYSQAVTQSNSNPFYRKVDYTLGVVEHIHRTGHNAYARISVRRGEQLSIKVSQNTTLLPGNLLQITETKTQEGPKHHIYAEHKSQVSPRDHPLCQGRVKWFDAKRKVWTVKVRSSKQYLTVDSGNPRLLKDQTIYFIPKFPRGLLGIGSIVDHEGGIPKGTLPTWVISKPVTDLLESQYGKLSVIDPYTKADSESITQLVNAPPDLSYLQLEELAIRQSLPSSTDWEQDTDFQRKLQVGLSPLQYIADNEPDKIRKLKADIRAIQSAGLQRVIRVLYPAPAMANATSIRTTMATMLVNPNHFPISSIRIYTHPGSITRILGDSHQQMNKKLMIIEMDTALNNPNFPVSTESQAFQSNLQAPSTEVQEELKKHNLLILADKKDPRLQRLKSQRPGGCRLTTTQHPCHRSHVPMLFTFEQQAHAQAYLLANRTSSNPMFMQNAYDLHHSPLAKGVTTTRMVSPSEWALHDLGEVYPIHQTKYVVHMTDSKISLEAHLRLLNAARRGQGHKALFVQTQDRNGYVTPLNEVDSTPAVIAQDSLESKDHLPEPDDLTSLVATGFPSYAPKHTITKTLAKILNTPCPPGMTITHQNDSCSAFFYVSYSRAMQLVNRPYTTPMGTISIQQKAEEDPGPAANSTNESSQAPASDLFETLFPQRTHNPHSPRNATEPMHDGPPGENPTSNSQEGLPDDPAPACSTHEAPLEETPSPRPSISPRAPSPQALPSSSSRAPGPQVLPTHQPSSPDPPSPLDRPTHTRQLHDSPNSSTRHGDRSGARGSSNSSSNNGSYSSSSSSSSSSGSSSSSSSNGSSSSSSNHSSSNSHHTTHRSRSQSPTLQRNKKRKRRSRSRSSDDKPLEWTCDEDVLTDLDDDPDTEMTRMTCS